MAKLIKKFASGKILSIEDFTFNLINPIKQNKSFINSDKFSQEFNSNDLLEFKSMLLDDLKINEGQIEEDKGENIILKFLLESELNTEFMSR